MKGALKRFYSMYADGFRQMTVGRQLWVLIIVKCIILFGILKLFFFPDVIKEKTPEGADPSQTVRCEVLDR